MARCARILGDGERCPRAALPGSNFCRVHAPFAGRKGWKAARKPAKKAAKRAAKKAAKKAAKR